MSIAVAPYLKVVMPNSATLGTILGEVLVIGYLKAAWRDVSLVAVWLLELVRGAHFS